VSEWELRERMEPEEEGREEVEALGAGEEPLFLPTPPFMASTGVGDGVFSCVSSVGPASSPPPFSWVRFTLFGRKVKGSLQRAALRGLRTGKPGKMYAAMIYIVACEYE